jgi:CDP-diacylglycerol--glycerol-3-phosphate 3-phosphatidyltransferase
MLGDPELLDGFIQRHQVLFQQDLAGVGVDQSLDRRYVRGSRTSHHRPVGRGTARCAHGCTVSERGNQIPACDDADRVARLGGAGNQVPQLDNRYSDAVSGQPQTGPVVPRVRVTNLANVLTLLRLVLVPVFLLVLFSGNGHETVSRIAAFVVFAVAVVTDKIDGALARNYGMVTEFGTMADPIADKTLIGAALIGLSMLGDLPWWVTVVILAREVGITVLRFVVLRRGVIPASRGGKLKTLVQAVAIGLFILPLSGSWLVAASVVMAVAILLTLVTGVDYVLSAARDVRGRPATD